MGNIRRGVGWPPPFLPINEIRAGQAHAPTDVHDLSLLRNNTDAKNVWMGA